MSSAQHSNGLKRVAMCLNRFIFESPKAHDALLFMTILSTDLRALKRRGYNGPYHIAYHCIFISNFVLVDRILRQRKLEKQAEEARAREENIKLLSQTSPIVKEDVMSLSSKSSTAVSDVAEPPERAASLMDTVQKFKRKVGTVAGSGLRGQTPKADSPRVPEPQHLDQDPPIPGGFAGGSNPQRPIGMDSPTITSLNNIGKDYCPE